MAKKEWRFVKTGDTISFIQGTVCKQYKKGGTPFYVFRYCNGHMTINYNKTKGLDELNAAETQAFIDSHHEDAVTQWEIDKLKYQSDTVYQKPRKKGFNEIIRELKQQKGA